MTILPFLHNVNKFILNPIIGLLFGIALLILFVGIFQFIGSREQSMGHETGKKKILYGLIGMLIMFSAYGLIHLVLGTFGLSDPAILLAP